MDENIIARIEADPNYKKLKHKRNMLGIILTLITFFIYYGWITIIAFNKEFLAQRIGDGVTTIAVPIGIAVIVIMVLLTAIYVLIANKTYDHLIDQIKEDVTK